MNGGAQPFDSSTSFFPAREWRPSLHRAAAIMGAHAGCSASELIVCLPTSGSPGYRDGGGRHAPIVSILGFLELPAVPASSLGCEPAGGRAAALRLAVLYVLDVA